MKGWFFPDFLSSFPFDLVIGAFVTDGAVSPEARDISPHSARSLARLRNVRSHAKGACVNTRPLA